jgi:acyl-CoA thioesterase-1
MRAKGRAGVIAGLAAVIGVWASAPAPAQVIAFGASNVSGYGVDPSQNFVSVLQAMLQDKGYRVRVVNAGIYGNTTPQMLARLDADTPAGTTVVILDQTGGPFNDAFHRISSAKAQADMAEITARLKARGVVVIPMSGASLPREDHQADGAHLNVAGHRLIAAQLLPQVMAALGPPPR